MKWAFLSALAIHIYYAYIPYATYVVSTVFVKNKKALHVLTAQEISHWFKCHHFRTSACFFGLNDSVPASTVSAGQPVDFRAKLRCGKFHAS